MSFHPTCDASRRLFFNNARCRVEIRLTRLFHALFNIINSSVIKNLETIFVKFASDKIRRSIRSISDGKIEDEEEAEI